MVTQPRYQHSQMRLERPVMFKQLLRMWNDDGRNDRDFSIPEQKLKEALEELKNASNSLSRASEHLLYVINTQGLG